MCSQDLSWLVGELRALAGDLNASEAGTPLVVAIDQGGHASRAIAYDLNGGSVAEAFAPISTFRSGNDRVEHDALEITESIRTALTDLRAALGDDANRVAAAGLATQRSSIACWDKRTHKPLCPVLSWQDRRNAVFVDKLKPHEAQIRAVTGLVLSPHYGASKLRWCLDNIDAVRKAANSKRLSAAPLSAWLLHSLLSEHPQVVDPVNAARTQLFDIRERKWSADLLKRYGVPSDVLPQVVPNRHPFGHLPFGDRSVPLILCTGDQAAMPFANGAPDDTTIYLNIGTGAFLQRIHVQAVAPVPPGLLGSVLWEGESEGRTAFMHAIEGTVNGAGSAIDWLNERIGIDCHRAAHALSRAKVGKTVPPIFINGISGVGSPFWRAQLDSQFIGEGNETAKVIAVVESVAFLICANIELMRDNVRRVLASGGLAASDYLCECIATLSGLTVERTTLQESTATGLAYLIAGQPKSWSPRERMEKFTPVANSALTNRFKRWRDAMIR